MLSYDNRHAMAQPTPPTSTLLPISSLAASATRAASSKAKEAESNRHHIWLITGPAGCGKSTVAQFIADALDLPFIEGDEYHPPANVQKMSSGIPLTDADRWDWLVRLREESVSRIAGGASGVVLTCSALKRKYRDVIRIAPYYSASVAVHFVYLHASEGVLLERVKARHGHFMAASMVHSQFDALEEPGQEESDVITVDVSASLEVVEQEALRKIREACGGEGA